MLTEPQYSWATTAVVPSVAAGNLSWRLHFCSDHGRNAEAILSTVYPVQRTKEYGGFWRYIIVAAGSAFSGAAGLHACYPLRSRQRVPWLGSGVNSPQRDDSTRVKRSNATASAAVRVSGLLMAWLICASCSGWQLIVFLLILSPFVSGDLAVPLLVCAPNAGNRS